MLEIVDLRFRYPKREDVTNSEYLTFVPLKPPNTRKHKNSADKRASRALWKDIRMSKKVDSKRRWKKRIQAGKPVYQSAIDSHPELTPMLAEHGYVFLGEENKWVKRVSLSSILSEAVAA